MCLDLRLLTQNRGSFLTWCLIDQIRLILVLLASPKREVATILVRICRERLLVVVLGRAVAGLMNVRVYQLGEGALRYQIRMLRLPLLLPVRLGLPHISRLFLAGIPL